MAALIKKHSVVPAFKKAGVSYSSKFRLKKRSLSFGIIRYFRYFFGSHKVNMAYLPNYNARWSKSHTYLNITAAKSSRLVF